MVILRKTFLLSPSLLALTEGLLHVDIGTREVFAPADFRCLYTVAL